MQNNYTKEEEVETPEMQVDNLNAQAGAIQAADSWSVEQLGTIYDKTLEMWNAAEGNVALGRQRLPPEDEQEGTVEEGAQLGGRLGLEGPGEVEVSDLDAEGRPERARLDGDRSAHLGHEATLLSPWVRHAVRFLCAGSLEGPPRPL